MRTRLTPLLLYVAVAALAAPGVLLAAEEQPPAGEAQPGQAPGTGSQGAAPGDAAPPAGKEPAPEQPPAEKQAAEEPPARALSAPAPEPAREPAQVQPAAQAQATEPADKPAKKKAEQAEEPAPTARASAASVTIKDFSFGPQSVTVNVGETVTWTNSGPTAHSATANDGSFDTGVFKKGQTRSHTFEKAGTFSYICTPHPNMKGTVRVASASGTPSDDSDSAGSTGSGSGSDDSAGAAADSDSGPSLPASGADAWVLALLGAGLLALGFATRRRAGA